MPELHRRMCLPSSSFINPLPENIVPIALCTVYTIIRAKKAVWFETKRAEWCTFTNMKEMYTEVYFQLVETVVAIKHQERVWRDGNEDVVVDEGAAVGLKLEY